MNVRAFLVVPAAVAVAVLAGCGQTEGGIQQRRRLRLGAQLTAAVDLGVQRTRLHPRAGARGLLLGYRRDAGRRLSLASARRPLKSEVRGRALARPALSPALTGYTSSVASTPKTGPQRMIERICRMLAALRLAPNDTWI